MNLEAGTSVTLKKTYSHHPYYVTGTVDSPQNGMVVMVEFPGNPTVSMFLRED
jgi:hypothetical protein